jgi:YfiH family protein
MTADSLHPHATFAASSLGAQVIVPHWPGLPARVGALSTLRRGGVSAAPYDDGQGGGGLNLGVHVDDAPEAVAANRALLRALLPAEPAWLTQVHGTTVIDAAHAQAAPRADASIATEAGAVCVIMTADCMPVLLADAEGKVVGAAHAGWRGLAAGVLEATVAAMRAAGAGPLTAWLGPGIGPRHFEVGAEVPPAFDHLGDAARAAFLPLDGKPGKFLGDLPQLARLALARAGVSAVHGGDDCTVSDASRFYSFRRDRVTGRMASLVWIHPT